LYQVVEYSSTISNHECEYSATCPNAIRYVRRMDTQLTGDKLRQARRAMRLTQKALGDAVGVSGSAVGKWESGEAQPSYDRLVLLGQVLNGDPPPDNLNRLRDVVLAQQEVLSLLARETRERLGDDHEIAARLAALEVVLGQRRLL
jgi:transcriptional regulator with XRE-family HTH domain